MAGRPTGRLVLHLLFIAAVFMFIAGTYRLFVLRFESGDVFPPYSSLRADPLGVKVFSGSLSRVAGQHVMRNTRPLSLMDTGRGGVLFYLGAKAASLAGLSAEKARALELQAAGGGRVVISFYPEDRAPDQSGERDRARGEKDPPPGGSSPSPSDCLVSIPERWGFRFRRLSGRELSPPGRGQVRGSGAPAALRVGPEGAEDALPWRSTLVFSELAEPWKAVYTFAGQPAIVERDFGLGTIVLCADSYFISNEALRLERCPGALAWLTGGRKSIIFDETHLGVAENPGVASLARRYRLHGLLLGASLLGILFLWKNAPAFLPRPESARGAGGTAVTQDSHAAFVHLLRRSIPPADILPVCVQEWEKSLTHMRKPTDRAMKEIRELLIREEGMPASRRDPLAAFREITRIIRGERGG